MCGSFRGPCGIWEGVIHKLLIGSKQRVLMSNATDPSALWVRTPEETHGGCLAPTQHDVHGGEKESRLSCEEAALLLVDSLTSWFSHCVHL